MPAHEFSEVVSITADSDAVFAHYLVRILDERGCLIGGEDNGRASRAMAAAALFCKSADDDVVWISGHVFI